MTDRGTATGRVASTRGFLPTNVAETVAWFSARSGVTNVAGAASQLDSVIGSFSGTQATGAARPTIATGINSLPTLAFASASAQELTNTTTNLVTTNATRYVLIVAKSADAAGGSLLTFRFNTAGSTRVWVLQTSTSGGNRNYMTDGVSNSTSATLAGEPSIVSPFLIEYELTLGATPIIRINRNTRPVTGIIHATGEAGATGFHIGGREAAGGEKWNGDIADIYIASGIPSAADKTKLVNYFSAVNALGL